MFLLLCVEAKARTPHWDPLVSIDSRGSLSLSFAQEPFQQSGTSIIHQALLRHGAVDMESDELSRDSDRGIDDARAVVSSSVRHDADHELDLAHALRVALALAQQHDTQLDGWIHVWSASSSSRVSERDRFSSH